LSDRQNALRKVSGVDGWSWRSGIKSVENQEDRMAALEWVTAVLLFVVVGGIGMMKLTRNKGAMEQAERLGYLKIMMPIGVAEVAAAVAVIVGAALSDLAWIGRVAALGIIAMMIGASWYHHRAKDTFERAPSLVTILLAVGYLVALA
jgi:hypothetical protein